MDETAPVSAKKKRGRIAVGIVIALLVLYPEVAVTLYLLLSLILALRVNWLFRQGLNDLRRRYHS